MRTGAFCPNPIRMFPPRQVEKAAATSLARQLFRGILADFRHRLEHLTMKPDLIGIEARHRDIMMEIATRIRTRPELFTSVRRIAEDSGYSPDHFTRVFHKTMGCSPKAYVLNCRIDRAKHLLQESGLTIKEIADILCYSTPGFFSRQFKQVVGISPLGFREGRDKKDFSEG